VVSDVTYCQNAVAEVLTAEAAAGDNLMWYLPDGSASSAAPTPSTTTAGDIVYQVTASNGTCMSTKATLTVTIAAIYAYAGGPVVYVNAGQSATLLGQESGSNVTISWEPTIYLTNANTVTPTVTPLTDTTYTLTVSSGSCTDTSSVQVIVMKQLIIPNIFSPNGDGINDTWKITYLEEYPGAEVMIFNRWGQMLFSATGASYESSPWDGTYNGQPVPVGAYYYIINMPNLSKPMSGCVSVIR
jgi:gliding motility-associated-like protein